MAYDDVMTVPLPPEIERRLSAADGALHLAIGLYIGDRVTLEQGAAVAGLCTSHSLAELGKWRIPVHYDVEDALADIETAAKLAPRCSS